MDAQTKSYILIADDNKMIARVLFNKLTAAGYEVQVVENGDEAVRSVMSRKPDLLLMDLIMPVKDGFNALKELRANPDCRDVKVVVTSDLQQEDDAEKVRQLGVLAFTSKTNLQELVDSVPQYLQA